MYEIREALGRRSEGTANVGGELSFDDGRCSASPYPVLGTQHSPGIWYTLTTYIPDTRPITRCTYSTLWTYLTVSQTS